MKGSVKLSTIYKGGYITIDVKNGDVTSETDAPVIPGIYKALLDAKGKAVRFINVKFGKETYDVVVPTIVQYNPVTVDCYITTNSWIMLQIGVEDGIVATVIE